MRCSARARIAPVRSQSAALTEGAPLDPVSRTSVWEMISNLRENHGLTLFLTTHYMDEADRLCDRIAIVDKGQVVANDSIARLRDLMSLPTLEGIFSQLAVEQDTAAITQQIVNVMEM